MPAIFKAAFIFVAPNADPSQDYSWVRTNEVHVKTVAVSNYQQACELIDALVEEGIKAANGRLHVGAVRFDNHPCLDFTSGDALF